MRDGPCHRTSRGVDGYKTKVAIGTGSSPFAFTGSGFVAITTGSCKRGAELSTFFLLRALPEPLRSVGRADT